MQEDGGQQKGWKKNVRGVLTGGMRIDLVYQGIGAQEVRELKQQEKETQLQVIVPKLSQNEIRVVKATFPQCENSL